MMNREEHMSELFDRASNYRTIRLADLIEKENLHTYRFGYEDILWADELNVATVPCRGYMILAREFYNADTRSTEAEYAIYSEHDDDGKPLLNSINMNAKYRIEFMGQETFENTAFAIAYAADLIRKITDMDKENN